jgi:hypothetical protein
MRRILSLTLMLASATSFGVADAESPLISLTSQPNVLFAIDDEGVVSCIRDDAFTFSLNPPAGTAEVSVQLTVSGVEEGNLGSQWTQTMSTSAESVAFPWSGFADQQGAYGAIAIAQAFDEFGEYIDGEALSFSGFADHREPQLNMQHPESGTATIALPAQIRAGFDEVMASGFMEASSSISGPVTGELIIGAAEMTIDVEPPVMAGELSVEGYALDSWCNRGSFGWTSGPVVGIG